MSAELDSKGLEAAPEWIRVDREGVGVNGGFWTCAAATQSSPKYIRADIHEKTAAALSDANKKVEELTRERGEWKHRAKVRAWNHRGVRAERDALAADNAVLRDAISLAETELSCGLYMEARRTMKAALSNQSTASLKVGECDCWRPGDCDGSCTHPKPTESDRIVDLRIALNDIIGLDHHWHGPESRATEIARAALIRDDDAVSTAQPAEGQGERGEAVAALWQELCDKDDRTSPEEYPDMCLITHDEFVDFILRATPPTSQPLEGAVKVKVLEWRNLLFPVNAENAKTPFGDYRVASNDCNKDFYWLFEGERRRNVYISVDDAKAAAQADYERRIRSTLSAPAGDGWRAAQDVLAERRRQIEAEGWTPDHDDQHSGGEMAAAAAAYSFSAFNGAGWRAFAADPIGFWPWNVSWWKPTTPRRDLVKAGALIIAEIERLDRLPASPYQGDGR